MYCFFESMEGQLVMSGLVFVAAIEEEDVCSPIDFFRTAPLFLFLIMVIELPALRIDRCFRLIINDPDHYF